jgi:N-acetylglucosaminyl-diphospho-decaprenol L-rhamnosyltransferase
MAQIRPGRPPVSAIVLTFRSASTLGDCIRSLEPQVTAVGGELVIVDNASPDDTVEVARNLGHEPVISSGNLGFAAGCNLGARHASGEVLLFVNPDAVLDAGCVQAVLDVMAATGDIGIVGGRAHMEEGAYDPRCVLGVPSLRGSLTFAFGLDTMFRHHPFLAPEQGPADLRVDRPFVTVPAVSGSLLAVARPAWKRLEGFDEQFFLYGEDVDLCLRAGSGGWRTVVATGAGYRHVGGVSSSPGLRDILLYRGKVELYRRQLSPSTARVAVTALQAGTLLRCAVGVVAGPRHTDRAHRWRHLYRTRRAWREGHPGRGAETMVA